MLRSAIPVARCLRAPSLSRIPHQFRRSLHQYNPSPEFPKLKGLSGWLTEHCIELSVPDIPTAAVLFLVPAVPTLMHYVYTNYRVKAEREARNKVETLRQSAAALAGRDALVGKTLRSRTQQLELQGYDNLGLKILPAFLSFTSTFFDISYFKGKGALLHRVQDEVIAGPVRVGAVRVRGVVPVNQPDLTPAISEVDLTQTAADLGIFDHALVASLVPVVIAVCSWQYFSKSYFLNTLSASDWSKMPLSAFKSSTNGLVSRKSGYVTTQKLADFQHSNSVLIELAKIRPMPLRVFDKILWGIAVQSVIYFIVAWGMNPFQQIYLCGVLAFGLVRIRFSPLPPIRSTKVFTRPSKLQ